MSYFLLVYDRKKGDLHRITEFPEEQAEVATRERFRLELEQRGSPDIEVVVVGAPSREALERTHVRYFLKGKRSADELLARVDGHVQQTS